MRQLPLAIRLEPVTSFESFTTGQNAAAIAHLQALIPGAPPTYLWGLSGSGKTHLLQATAQRIRLGGGHVASFVAGEPLPWQLAERVDGERCDWLLLDDCHGFDAAEQHAAFALFVEATDRGAAVLAAGNMPPVDLAVREDLRTRLGWGHVFALEPLAEGQARAVLRREADRRGSVLSDEVIDYLMTRFARDLKHLMAQLDRLDAFSLATQRTITVPLLKQMLAEESTA